MKKTILLILIMLNILPGDCAKKLGTENSGARFIGYINQDEYKVQTDNEITFIYKYQDGSERTYTKIPVFPNGMMLIPEYRETNVFEMTSSELKELIKKKLNLLDIDLFIYRVPNNISVLGEVKNPGSYAMKNIKTVYDGIAKAGGFTNISKKSKVQLIRQKVDGTRVSYIINFPKEVFDAYEPGSGVGEEVYILQEGDLIYVHSSTPKKIWELFKKALAAATFGVFTGLTSSAFD